MSNVMIFPGEGGRDASAILEVARNAGLIDVVVVGWTAEGNSFLSTSHSSSESVAWDLLQALKVVAFE